MKGFKRWFAGLTALVLCFALLGVVPAAEAAAARKKITITMKGDTVKIVYLGSVQSVVKIDGKKQTVATADLEWETNADADSRVMRLNAPKGSKINLRLTEKPKSGLIAKCESGRLVLVFEKGEKRTGIVYGNTAGYVSTSMLEKVSIPEEVKIGTATYKGNVKSSKSVALRKSPLSKGRKLASIRSGSEVLIFGEKDGWMEVEAKGYHGYMQTKSIVVDATKTIETGVAAAEGAVVAPAEATKAPDATVAADDTADTADEEDAGEMEEGIDPDDT